MYGKQTEWETWGSGHLRSREEEVDALKDLLPAGCELSKDHVKTSKANCLFASKRYTHVGILSSECVVVI